MEMTLVARFYERLADHAVNIARRVVYLAGSARDWPVGLHRKPGQGEWAIAAFVGGVIFLVLSILGFLHMRRTPAEGW